MITALTVDVSNWLYYVLATFVVVAGVVACVVMFAAMFRGVMR